MKFRVSGTLLFLFILSTAIFGQDKSRLNFYEQMYSARSLGMSNAFTAQADDLSAAWLNPAGLAFSKVPNLYLNYLGDHQEYSYLDQESGESLYSYSGNMDLKNLNFFSISSPVVIWGTNFTFAVSYYRYFPYALEGNNKGIEIKNDKIIEQLILEFKGSYGIDILAFSGSFMINEYFSAGITHQIFLNSGNMTLNHKFLENEEDYSEIEKLGIKGSNLIFGAIFRPDESFSLAFSCETRVKGQYKYLYNKIEADEVSGNTKNEESSESDILIPYRLNLGLSVKIMPFLRISYDHKRVYWSRSTISDFLDNTSDIPFPSLDKFTTNQQDLICNRFGFEVKIDYDPLKLFVRGGLLFDKQLYTDNSNKKIIVKGFSLGLGFYILNHLSLDIGFQHKSGSWTEKGYFNSKESVDSNLKDSIVSLSFNYSFLSVEN
jgi:long-subunit fatty acid transport protein